MKLILIIIVLLKITLKSQRIKTNHKALEKKQLEMDKLNKDYGELMKNKIRNSSKYNKK